MHCGFIALPVLLRIAAVMGHKEIATLAQHQPLPVEVDVGAAYHFHSVFVCPVSKELATADNRPMLLRCGHVLAEQSLARLGRTTHHRFKCPYCPVEQTRDAARPLFL